MAGSVSKVILVGNLGKDPEIRTMQSGDKVASFSIATSESWKDKASGERKEKTQWHNIVIWNPGLVTVAERYLKKGAKIYVEGQLETRKWADQAGVEKYTTEVVLRPFRSELTMLDSKGGEGGSGFRDSGGGGSSYQSSYDSSGPAPANSQTVDAMEDEIPF